MINYPLRMNEETYAIIKFISEKNKRSINKQIEFIVENYITEYQRINGKIEITEDE